MNQKRRNRRIQTVEIVNRQKKIELASFFPIVPTIVDAVLSVEKTTADYIGVFFLSDSTMRRYHQKYFQDSSSTDCMSFPIDLDDSYQHSQERTLGDIFICPEVAARMAKKEKVSLTKELSLYVIHATLHLLGYDDITKRDIQTMRQKEEEVFNFLQTHS